MSYLFGGPRTVGAFVLAVAMIIALGLTTANASAAPAPIKVGAVLTEGAAVGFPNTASRTLKAFFRDYNAKGGFKGRKVSVEVVNDGFSAEKNVAGTKKLIDAGVVALLGNQAIFNCLGNGSLLRRANLYALGWGAQAACYRLRQWGSVSPSIHTQVTLTTQYAKERIGGKVCLIGQAAPGADVLWKRAEQMLAKLGTRFAYKNVGVSPTADPTAALLGAKVAGCRSVQVVLSPGQTVQAANALKTQKITNMDLVLVNGYDDKTLKGIGDADGMYFFSYMYPFSANDSRSRAYRRFTNWHNITPDFYGEQAYVSAELFVSALKTIKGSVTRQSTGAAIGKLNTTNPMLPGRRFKFGGQGNGAPIVGGYMIQVKNGKFVLAPKAELSLPQKVRSLGGKI